MAGFIINCILYLTILAVYIALIIITKSRIREERIPAGIYGPASFSKILNMAVIVLHSLVFAVDFLIAISKGEKPLKGTDSNFDVIQFGIFVVILIYYITEYYLCRMRVELNLDSIKAVDPNATVKIFLKDIKKVKVSCLGYLIVPHRGKRLSLGNYQLNRLRGSDELKKKLSKLAPK